MVGKRLKLSAAWLLVLSILFTAGQSVSAADDITGHWAEEDMRFMVDRGFLKGDGNGYHPNKIITRGQFAVLLARVLELEPSSGGITFTDVDNRSGYLAEILAAAHAGIITGYGDGTFRPSEQINRQHMAVMMKRALDYLKIEGKTADYRFADEKEILPAYRVDLYELAGAGIFKGSEQPDGSYLFRPMNQAHRWEAATVLTRLIKLAEQVEGEIPAEPEEELSYATAETVSDGTTTVVKKYKSFEEAAGAMGNGQVVIYGDSIVKMQSGVVITKPTLSGSTLTNVFDHPDKMDDSRKAFTYVTRDSELEYLESTADYVKVKLAGKTGYIKHENALLKTWNMLKGRSYYTVNSEEELVHNVFSNQTGKYQSYTIGKAPDNLKEGQRYLSWNQIDYTDWRGNTVQTFYNYFQFLPARTETIYTAEELDRYIMGELARLEATGNATYKDATKKSKLIGIGNILKKVEKEKNINALLVLALAQHESAYGMSTKAQQYNNLFGLAIYDDAAADHPFHKYESVEDNVNTLADQYWNKNYIPPNGGYANGAAFGTKAVGFNVKYASDPYWGAKAAGHAYRIDKALGGRDFGRYTIGITKTTGMNVRTSPEVSDNLAFKYTKIGLPVTIVSSEYNASEKRTWYQVLSDDPRYETVWIAGENVQIVFQ
ncbi:Endo-1,4-beta-xylanase A precursor [Bhargavaea cecembensis DSE10]|uniref:Endo-1,4-beta-xylanase A n=1 Tax=Bhargavaea cecembensis DSE10 TaxID=1235279 RepID=M7NL60_9BACL|nr:S-layer homology domain-containing protein [Bhargavaea cecembensis]EMR07937.1 Endo-1,4-beta-xylanase A precursor [Bhargavaea cecembensis DSE10]